MEYAKVVWFSHNKMDMTKTERIGSATTKTFLRLMGLLYKKD